MEIRSAQHVRCSRAGRHFALGGLLVASLSAAFSGSQARGETDPAEWIAAQDLARQIQAPVAALSEKERKQFLTDFEELRGTHDQLQTDEQDLAARLSSDQNDLKRHAQTVADHEKARAAWQDELNQHNGRCNRTFTNPADVASCDQSGAELARQRADLDAEESDLAREAAELQANQSKDVGLVGQLGSDYATWRQRLEPEFNTPVRAALARKIGTTTLRLTVKSFIRAMDISSMSNAGARLDVFAWIANTNFSENPKTPSPDGKDFRLWSQVTAVINCHGDTIWSWKTSNLAHRGGTELRILDSETGVMEPLNVTPAPQGVDDIEELSLSYAIKGKPNDAALPSFQYVKARTCYNIWHRVHAALTCSDGSAKAELELSGSHYPSHRVWINNEVESSIDQGPLSDLWNCDPTAPDMVR